jgi:hypothetical protein
MQWVRKNYNSDLKIEGILNTMYEQRTKASSIAENKIFEIIGKYVFNTIIPKNTKIVESTFYGNPVITFDIESPGAKAYLSLAEELIVRNKVCPVIDLENSSFLKKIDREPENSNLLYENDPNPFNLNTIIKFEIKEENRVKLTILDIRREEIGTVLDKNLSPGVYQYKWIPQNIPDGVYYYRLEAGSFHETQKMLYYKNGLDD